MGANVAASGRDTLLEALRKSKAEREVLLEENRRLREQLLEEQGPSPSTTFAPLSESLLYLERCPFHGLDGVRVLDPAPYLTWADSNGVGARLLVGTVIPDNCPVEQLQEILDVDDFVGPGGPFEGGGALGISQPGLQILQQTLQEAEETNRVLVSHKSGILSQNLRGIISSWQRGDFRPVILRNIMYFSDAPTTFVSATHFLVIAQRKAPCDSVPPSCSAALNDLMKDGKPRICMLIHFELHPDLLDPRIWAGAMRDHMALKYVPAMVTTCDEVGNILSQNAASMASIGVHGADQLLTELPTEDLPAYTARPAFNYLHELLGSQAAVDAALEEVTLEGMFRRRVRIKSPTLLDAMQLAPNAQIYHDVSISKLKDGITKKVIYIIAQVDVTGVVQTERRVQRLQAQQRALLKKILPQQVIDVLLEDKRRRPTGGPRRMSQLMLMSSTNHSFHASRQSRDPSSTADPQIAENDDQNTDTRDSASTNPWRQSTSGGNPLLLSRGRSAMPSILIDNDTAPDTAKSRGVSTSGANEPNTPAGVTSRLRSPLLSRLSMLRAATVAAPPHLTYRDVQRLSTYHKNVSILFTDIQGFTAMSQSLHPAQVMLFLNRLFSVFDSLLEEHDAYKVETIGDCYMCATGLFDRTSAIASSPREDNTSAQTPAGAKPQTPCIINEDPQARSQELPKLKDVLGGYDPDHASKMLSFAKELVAAASAIETPLGEPVQLRVGIHSGPIMTGVVGRRMPRFCCFGDTVNVASRMEQTGTAGVIHASAAFRDLTPDEPWEPTGGVEVPGKGVVTSYTLRYSNEWEALTL